MFNTEACKDKDAGFKQLLEVHYELFYHLHSRSIMNAETSHETPDELTKTEKLREKNIQKEIKIILASRALENGKYHPKYTEISIFHKFEPNSLELKH